MIKYYLFCIKWLWNNRTWDNTRQKFKAMQEAYEKKVQDNGGIHRAFRHGR